MEWSLGGAHKQGPARLVLPEALGLPNLGARLVGGS